MSNPSTDGTGVGVQDRRNHVMVGELSEDFLRIGGNSAQQQQAMADERVAQILQAQQQAGYSTVPANIRGKINISIVQAKLTKNYGITRMDPYCRIRIGHAVFETPTSYNGGKNPQWGKEVQSYLPHGMDTVYVEIFDEKSFTADDRVAWAHITLPEAALNGETVDEWFNLSGKQGDEREGSINLVVTFTPVENLPPMMMQVAPMYMPQMPQMYSYPGFAPGMGYPPAPVTPAQPPVGQQGPSYTEEDFKQVKDMFPNMEDDVIQSVFAANNGNKDLTINMLLQMSAD